MHLEVRNIIQVLKIKRSVPSYRTHSAIKYERLDYLKLVMGGCGSRENFVIKEIARGIQVNCKLSI